MTKSNPTKAGALRKAVGAKKGATIPTGKLKAIASTGSKTMATKAKFALNKRKVSKKAK